MQVVETWVEKLFLFFFAVLVGVLGRSCTIKFWSTNEFAGMLSISVIMCLEDRG